MKLNALGYLAWFAACMVAAMPAANPGAHCAARNDYAVAESLGCTEVGRVCRAKKHSEAISEMKPVKAKRL